MIMSHTNTLPMSSVELSRHPEVELCSCSHPKGLHTGSGCLEDHAVKSCLCRVFAPTGRRFKNSLVTLNIPEPPPEAAGGPAMWDLVIADMRDRDRFGTEKYGQRLVAHDGRDAMKDAYQEALDLCVYFRKAIYERDGK